METLELLHGKLDQLIKRHNTLEADNKRLRATIDGQNKVIQRLHKKVNTLEAGMVSVHLCTADLTEEGKEDMRRQLDGVISEIDKILNTLND